MTLDESRQDDDEVLEIDGLSIVIDRALHNNLGVLRIDFVEGKGIEVAKE